MIILVQSKQGFTLAYPKNDSVPVTPDDRFLRIKTDGPAPHPYIGFSSLALAQNCLSALGVPIESFTFVSLNPRTPIQNSHIMLINSPEALSKYLSNPSTLQFERFTVPALKGFSAYLPTRFLIYVARFITNSLAENSRSAELSLADINPNTAGKNDTFITLLCAACEDQHLYSRLEQILTLPDEKRKSLLLLLLAEMRYKKAPQDFVSAMECLINTETAEKAYEAIFKCQRKIRF